MNETTEGNEFVESLLRFDGMLGVLAVPSSSSQTSPIGVVIVVGGPQTRVGSHRQFVTLARALAQAGHAVLRFDYTGMGDSSGAMPDFERAGPDIQRACDALLREVPWCRSVALWGLCDGATAALFHALNDARISGVIAANPWARSDATRSAALVSSHYGTRLRSPEFWKKLATGRIDLASSLREAAGHARRALHAKGSAGPSDQSLPGRLAQALLASKFPVRLQISGNDLTATEFELALKARHAADIPHVTRLRLEQADHTCSNPEDWNVAVADTLSFLSKLQASSVPHGRNPAQHKP